MSTIAEALDAVRVHVLMIQCNSRNHKLVRERTVTLIGDDMYGKVGDTGVLDEIGEEFILLKMRMVTALEWMIKDAKWKFDQLGPEGRIGGYSPELTEAIALLAELKGG